MRSFSCFPVRRPVPDIQPSALIDAVLKGRVDLVSIVLSESSSFLPLTTALSSAIANNHLSIVRLLSCDPRIDLDSSHAVHLACIAGHLPIVRYLCEHHDLSASPFTIRDAAALCHFPIVDYLLASASDPAALSSYCFRQAAATNQHIFLSKLLQDGRSDPNAMNGSAIRLAARFGHTEVVRLILADGRCRAAAANSEALRMAAKNGHEKIVAMLLEEGSSDAAANDSEATLNAVDGGYEKIVQMLLKNGEHWLDRAMEKALQKDEINVIKMLAEDGRGSEDWMRKAKERLDKRRREDIRRMMVVAEVDPIPRGVQVMIMEMAFGAMMEGTAEIHAVLTSIRNRLREPSRLVKQ